MGYINFDAMTGNATIAPTFAVPDMTASSDARLGSLEWSVVALARRDPLSSLQSPGRIAIAMGSVFGGRRTLRLACPRLEALRRISVLSWHRGFAVHAKEVTAFTNAGFTLDQYERLAASIARARAASERSERG